MIKIGIGLGNDLVRPGDKPLVEPMLKQLKHKNAHMTLGSHSLTHSATQD